MASITSDTGEYVTTESDECFDMFCEHCKKDFGIVRKAEVLCVECLECMCETCGSLHKRDVPNHEFKEGEDMPKYFCSLKCDIHNREIIKLYCVICRKSACPTCKIRFHSYCSNFKYIPYLVESETFDNDVKSFEDKLTQLADNLKANEESIKRSMCQVCDNENETRLKMKDHKEKIKREIEEQRQQIIAELDKKKMQLYKMLDAREEELYKELHDAKKRDSEKLQVLEKKASYTRSQIDGIARDMQRYKSKQDYCRLFSSMKSAEQELEAYESEAVTLTIEACNINCLSFEASDENVSLSKEINVPSFGSLNDRSKIKRKATFINSITVEDSMEGFFPTTSGICKVSLSQLVILDFINKYIRLINIKENGECELRATLQVSAGPSNVTTLNNNKIAVSMPDEGIIQIIFVSEQNMLVKTDQINVRKNCMGITCEPGRMFVSYTGSNKVDILDMKGNLLEQIENVFSCPKQLVKNPSLSTLFVNDLTRVTIIKHPRRILQKSKTFSEEIMAMTVDKTGTVYIGINLTINGSQTGRIYQLSSDLVTIHELLTDCVLPQSLYYCDLEDKLYIGHFGNVKVFKITY